MDNHQMKVDSYGRLIHVPEYPEAPEPMVAEEAWARAERVKRLEDRVDALQLANYEITRSLSEMKCRKKTDWVDKELAKIKELPNERTCLHCR